MEYHALPQMVVARSAVGEGGLPSVGVSGRKSNGGGARRRDGAGGPPRLRKWKVNSPRSGAGRHGERGSKVGVFLAGTVT